MEINLDIDGERKGQPIKVSGAVRNQYAVPGRWLRGNLHCHLEEGGWVDTAARIYQDLGYDFLAGMDHDRAVALDAPKDMLVIPGAEMGPGHLLVFGLDDVSSLQTAADDRTDATAEVIIRAKQEAGSAFLAHPLWSGWTWEEMKYLCDAGLDGMEVVNSGGWASGDTVSSDQIWHQMLDRTTVLSAIGGDDAHGPGAVMEGGYRQARQTARLGWTGVLVEDFSVEGVLGALREGRTYASEGPEFRSVELRPDGKLIVRCSPCVTCHFRGKERGYGGRSAFPPEEQEVAEEFVFDFAVNGYRVKDYLVAILEDESRRKAWLSPLRLELETAPARPPG